MKDKPNAIVSRLLEDNFEDEDFLVHIPANAKINKHDETGIDIEVTYDPNVGKWFELPGGGFVHVIRSRPDGKYDTEMYSHDLAVGPISLPQRFSPQWEPTPRPIANTVKRK
jgi:hypothetical protein